MSGRRIIRCGHGLWSTRFGRHVSNTLELEALCRALRTFRPWIFGAPVRAIMDNQAAVSFNNPAHLSDFLKRRLEHLSWYSPQISFCLGPFNYLADFLSRQGAWVSGPFARGAVEGHCHPVVTSPSQAQWKQAHVGHFGVRKTYLRFARWVCVQCGVGWKRRYVRAGSVSCSISRNHRIPSGVGGCRINLARSSAWTSWVPFPSGRWGRSDLS